MRFDSRGSLVSSNTVRGAGLGGVTVDSSGALYLTGKIATNGFFDFPTVQGFFTAKLSTNNTLLWVKSREYQGQDEDYISRGYDTRGTAIALDPQGNVIVGAGQREPSRWGPRSPAKARVLCSANTTMTAICFGRA